MSPRAPVFTIAEVNALIPRLEAVMARLHADARALQIERAATAEHGSAPPSMIELLRARPEARRLVEGMEAAANEVTALGGQLKDLSLGLVDFPGRLRGEAVLLCWQYGEPEVAYWHGPDEGFSGRRLLPGRRQVRPLQ